MTDIKLPPLPEPDGSIDDCAGHDAWDSLSMSAFARAAVEADRAALIAEVERFAEELSQHGRPSGAVIRAHLLPRLRGIKEAS
jgi:hypothetical protein